MHYKTLTQLSIGFVILIFISQAFLIFKLFQINKDLLSRELNLVSQEAYKIDMNSRFESIGSTMHPKVSVVDKNTKILPEDELINIDEMTGIDKSNSLALINIGLEIYLSKEKPIQLQKIDSIASALLAEQGIHSTIYSQIIDIKSRRIWARSKKVKPSSSLLIKSKNIPLNFEQTKVLQIVLLNPLRDIFSQMAGILLLSFLMSIFCIYCLYILQRTLLKQKKLAQSKNDFYNQVSHELKRPISVMHKAIDSLLNTKAIDDHDRREKYLNLSMDELNRMNGKIDMILTLSMEEEGMFRLNVSEFNLIEMIQDIKDRSLELSQKPVTFHVSNLLSDPLVAADKDHLSQCISNLIENAIKYSKDSVEIKLTLSEANHSIFISVQDNGIGIKEDDLYKIFEKFVRVSSNNKMPGYGIGLNFVKQIIEKHGGSISVSSEFGKGSEFILQLPQK